MRTIARKHGIKVIKKKDDAMKSDTRAFVMFNFIQNTKQFSLFKMDFFRMEIFCMFEILGFSNYGRFYGEN